MFSGRGWGGSALARGGPAAGFGLSPTFLLLILFAIRLFREYLVPDRLACLHVHDFDVAAIVLFTVDGKNLIVYSFKPDLITIFIIGTGPIDGAFK